MPNSWQTARANGAAVVLDAEGEQLRHALGARPDVAKPNAVEVAHLFGRPVTTRREARDAARLLCDSGAATGIVSLGAEGFVAVTPSAAYDVRLPRPMHGNQTGAGDALAARSSPAGSPATTRGRSCSPTPPPSRPRP